MKREIKFRAWNGANWYVFNFETFAHATVNTMNRVLAKESTVVCQFTGLHDKNGKEIWEGDILLVPDTYTDVIVEGRGPTEPDNHLLPVEFRDGEFGIEVKENKNVLTKGFRSLSFLTEEIGVDETEVIGNIYENPELLK